MTDDPNSDQVAHHLDDIEGRLRALYAELRGRKPVATEAAGIADGNALDMNPLTPREPGQP